MALILNIFTVTETASLSLMKNGEELAMEINRDQRDHAAWLQPAIDKMLKDNGYTPSELEAIAVAAGPGSYTGLRVGMATAKGLCYALNIPLITESTLKVMAHASIENWYKNKSINTEQITLFCPMIDARRQEVFSAVFNEHLEIIEKAGANILDENSYSALLPGHQIVFSGSGSSKFEKAISSKKAVFQLVETTAHHLGTLSYQKYLQSAFSNLAYSEPEYLKEFHFYAK